MAQGRAIEITVKPEMISFYIPLNRHKNSILAIGFLCFYHFFNDSNDMLFCDD